MSHSTLAMARKVPELGLYFWVVKILTTGMGEATSDTLAHGVGPVVAVGLGAAGLAIALWLQFRTSRYTPWAYWLTVVMVAIFGTMAADGLHVVIGIPYVISSIMFAVILVAIFVIWRHFEHTLSVHSITCRRRELFYWATVMATFALGTAVGDMTATTLHLGYLASGVLFAVLFALPALGYWKLGLNDIAAFWACYILTRPLGASFADWIAVSHARGGLGFGTGVVSLVLAVMIAMLVVRLSVSRASQGRDQVA
jgi:uncharacterized membrane-anchored protein